MISAGTARASHLLDRFAHELVVALLNLGMHAPTSQLVRDSLRDLVATLRELLADGQPALRVELADGNLHACGRALIGGNLQASTLLALCARSNIAALEFAALLDADEAGRFLAALLEAGAAAAASRLAPGDLERLLVARGVQHAHAHTARGGAAAADTGAHGVRGYRELTSFLHDNHVAAFRGEDLQIERAAGVVEQAIQDIQQEPSGLLTLASYDDIDSFTVGHSVRVALLALHVARAAGVSATDLVAIGTAALLHDVGKSRVPQQILCKRGRLDDEEWRIMAQHPRLGAEILLEQRHLDPRAIGAAFCHHMAPAGRGYPRPALHFIPSEVSKLVRVCDVFEALTAVRPYKRALTPIQAYAVMFDNEHDFDPTTLHFFARTIGLYPLGTRVLLNTGAEACVVAHGADPHGPVVALIAGSVADGTAARAPRVTVGDRVDGRVIEIAAVFGAGANRDEIAEVLRTMHCGVSCPVDGSRDHA